VKRDRLVVDAGNCPGGGRLVSEPDCRRTVVDALRDVDVDAVVTHYDGLERAYLDDAAALLVAAGRFVDRVAFHDDRLADLATSDPLGAAREATGRAPQSPTSRPSPGWHWVPSAPTGTTTPSGRTSA